MSSNLTSMEFKKENENRMIFLKFKTNNLLVKN